MRRFVLLFTLTYVVVARAEYRVFELHIVDTKTGVERVEISNLDPAQYVQYRMRGLTERVTYKKTWMCKGNTAGQNFCPSPSPK